MYQRNSTFRQAFIDTKVKGKLPKIATTIVDMLDHKVGLIRQREWNLLAGRKTVEKMNGELGLPLKPGF